jgi:hypothetical protein
LQESKRQQKLNDR